VKLCLAESMSFIGSPTKEKERSGGAADTDAINTPLTTLAVPKHAGNFALEAIEPRRGRLLSILLSRTVVDCPRRLWRIYYDRFRRSEIINRNGPLVASEREVDLLACFEKHTFQERETTCVDFGISKSRGSRLAPAA
jgi:hypothetical protein